MHNTLVSLTDNLFFLRVVCLKTSLLVISIITYYRATTINTLDFLFKLNPYQVLLKVC